MFQPHHALAKLFRQEFELCKVQPGETIAVLTEPNSNEHYIAATMSAMAMLDAKPYQLMVPIVPETGRIAMVERGTGFSDVLGSIPGVLDLLKRTNMIIDLTVEGQIHSPLVREILQAGSRMLFIKEPPDALARLIPTPERTQRLYRGVELIRNAKSMRITSKAGTDLRVNLEGALPACSIGHTDKPGRWANWGNGFTLAYPKSNDADGTIVLAPGDIVYPLKEYMRTTVRMTMKQAFVTAIEGDGLDAEIVRDYVARWNDPNGYGLSHVGWGGHERALWHALTLYRKDEAIGCDGRSFEGNFLFSIGPNDATGRHTLCHLDIPMRNCSVYLDNRAVVIDGAIVEPSLMRPQ